MTLKLITVTLYQYINAVAAVRNSYLGGSIFSNQYNIAAAEDEINMLNEICCR